MADENKPPASDEAQAASDNLAAKAARFRLTVGDLVGAIIEAGLAALVLNVGPEAMRQNVPPETFLNIADLELIRDTIAPISPRAKASLDGFIESLRGITRAWEAAQMRCRPTDGKAN